MDSIIKQVLQAELRRQGIDWSLSLQYTDDGSLLDVLGDLLINRHLDECHGSMTRLRRLVDPEERDSIAQFDDSHPDIVAYLKRKLIELAMLHIQETEHMRSVVAAKIQETWKEDEEKNGVKVDPVSVGPFSHNCGSGRRVIRKSGGMA